MRSPAAPGQWSCTTFMGFLPQVGTAAPSQVFLLLWVQEQRTAQGWGGGGREGSFLINNPPGKAYLGQGSRRNKTSRFLVQEEVVALPIPLAQGRGPREAGSRAGPLGVGLLHPKPLSQPRWLGCAQQGQQQEADGGDEGAATESHAGSVLAVPPRAQSMLHVEAHSSLQPGGCHGEVGAMRGVVRVLGAHSWRWAPRWNQLGTRSGSCPAQPVLSYLSAGRPELGAVESYRTWTKEGPRSARRFLSRRVKLQRRLGAELLRLGQEGATSWL